MISNGIRYNLDVVIIAYCTVFSCRCVPDTQRSFGLGIQWIVVRTLGGIPGPIAFGSVIDISCLLWEEQCGEYGSCYLYHNSAMSQYSLIAGIIYKVEKHTLEYV